LLEVVISDRARTLGEAHPDTLTARGTLAYAYLSAGRRGEAIPLYEAVLADRVRVLGETHPNTLAARNNLAHAYHSTGGASEERENETREQQKRGGPTGKTSFWKNRKKR
jgi:hypothetical protein